MFQFPARASESVRWPPQQPGRVKGDWGRNLATLTAYILVSTNQLAKTGFFWGYKNRNFLPDNPLADTWDGRIQTKQPTNQLLLFTFRWQHQNYLSKRGRRTKFQSQDLQNDLQTNSRQNRLKTRQKVLETRWKRHK